MSEPRSSRFLILIVALVACGHRAPEHLTVAAAQVASDGAYVVVATSSDSTPGVDLARIAPDGRSTWTTKTSCRKIYGLAVGLDVVAVRCSVDAVTSRLSAYSVPLGAELWHQDRDESDMDGGGIAVVDDAVVGYGKSGLSVLGSHDGAPRLQRDGDFAFGSLFLSATTFALSAKNVVLHVDVHHGVLSESKDSPRQGCVNGTGLFERTSAGIVRRELTNLDGPRQIVLGELPKGVAQLRECGSYEDDHIFVLDGVSDTRYVLRLDAGWHLKSSTAIPQAPLPEEPESSLQAPEIDVLPRYPQLLIGGGPPTVATLDLDSATVVSTRARYKAMFRSGPYWISETSTAITVYDGRSNHQSPNVRLRSNHGIATQFGEALVGGDRIWAIGDDTFERGKLEVAQFDMNLSLRSASGIAVAK